ncbi:DUF3536 domain-containing protein [Candidatus Uabimicrobium sp. HlEnr_7]|uniref:DUF3536 domain-containing protein n=1 Tax=Candidatus Uabimicrobium helgolandensis TaxID=3095367 RepID=UPI0035571CBA
MDKYICIHGHFYQPPRENPWTGKIEKQPSAAPYHDWNERITAECYESNSHCEIFDHSGIKVKDLNNYAHISFNFGPTLLSWMERSNKKAYESILRADVESIENFNGHGSAIAQVYNHIIMPLANERDKKTQIVWGIKDFEYRFKRRPVGMWLAETAVDTATLELLAENDIRFTILAPRQAKRVREIGKDSWESVAYEKIDPFRAYLCKLPSGKSINLFFYDGPISQDIAFDNLLANGESFADRLLHILFHTRAQLVHIATDGETYGHHHNFGNKALAYCLNHIMNNEHAKLSVYSEFIEKFPAEYEVEIFEDSSWSCMHGVERWRDDCGCGSEGGGQQLWRAPLRRAMDWLVNESANIFEKQMQKFDVNPWEIRNHYIDLILENNKTTEFFKTHFSKRINERSQKKILTLLDMQHQSLLMQTSCGWFFEEISRLEGIQIMAYARKCLEIGQDFCFRSLEKKYCKLLEEAPSNMPQFKNGADIYQKIVKKIPRS